MPADAAPSFVLVAELPASGQRLTLPDNESHYVTRVCRARPGDRLSATDGRGALATLRLLSIGTRAEAEVESCDRVHPERTAWVLSGPPQGERGDWMVEKLAELGVGVFQPLDCERGRWERMKGRAERWRRVSVAALRQSRRRQLMEVRLPLTFADAMATLPAGGRWVCEAAGVPAAASAPPGRGAAIGVIGPASGFSSLERNQIESLGFARIALCDSRLRTETAALAWACWWSGSGRSAMSLAQPPRGLDAPTERP